MTLWLLLVAVCISWTVFSAVVLGAAFVSGFRDARARIHAERLQAELNRAPEEPLSEMTVCQDGEPVRVDLYHE